MTTSEPITLRRATDADRTALARLAALDSARPLTGETLVAEVAGEPIAALALATGATVADPFRRTARALDLLGRRASNCGDWSTALVLTTTSTTTVAA